MLRRKSRREGAAMWESLGGSSGGAQLVLARRRPLYSRGRVEECFDGLLSLFNGTLEPQVRFLGVLGSEGWFEFRGFATRGNGFLRMRTNRFGHR